MKRKNVSDECQHTKRVKLNSTSHKNTTPNQNNGQRAKDQICVESTHQSGSAGNPPKAQKQTKVKAEGTANVAIPTSQKKHIPRPSIRRENIRKLAPPRPFPSVPASVSASGPKSAHKEGKNLICITRHTPLAAYLSRCKKLLVEEGYSVLHLHAMGAAIPHLLTLSVSLPTIIPFAKDDIRCEVRTGTIEVLDEVIPDDEDEDISVRTRGKGGVIVMFKVQGVQERVGTDKPSSAEGSGEKAGEREVVIVQEQEQEQEDEEMD